ncbi:hypothetical protein [Desulfogranum japonicum]|uniref:hypothetical protein n=1 Tax=Desulfogranum japonicum TaxID=231447 RepID=UPI0003FE5DB3|nr:hypothetical protein [Desulfogranum japonicum]
MNIVDLYKEDGFEPRRASGRELQGPCPLCGGNDRFCLYPGQGEGKAAGLGTFHCGHGKGGAGCGKGGDAISYLTQIRGMSFGDACAALGIETTRPSNSMQYRSPKPPKVVSRHSFDPRRCDWPGYVVDPDMWQQHAQKFVDICHETLLNRPLALAYLEQRGVGLDQVKKYRLGIHLGKEKDDKQWLPSFRPQKSWGMVDEQKNGKPQKFILPAGIVIPYFNGHGLRRIRIRLAKKDQQNPKKKYHVVKGSAMDTWLQHPEREAFVVVETELDGAMIDRFTNRVGIVALGALAMKPDTETATALSKAHSILLALDYDGEAPKALQWWMDNYPQCKRWPVPVGKDPGEAYEQGLDIDEWILAGLPAAMQLTDEIVQETTPPAAHTLPDEVAELLDLFLQSGGAVKIYDQGMGVGPVIPDEWSARNPEKRARITQLIHSADQAGEFIEHLPDAVYRYPLLSRLANTYFNELEDA